MSDFFWKPEQCDADLNSALRVVAEFYKDRLAEGKGDAELVFQRISERCVKVTRSEGGYRIEAGSVSGFLRGAGHAFAGVEAEESTPFETLGIMLDCSRNKVFSLSYLKGMLVKLSLMGYNMVMLYTEETYQIPDEPFFGYMRGGFSMEELKELDAFARGVGIELIGCIQTLGHLEQLLNYRLKYGKIRDTSSVLMVDEPETYVLIEKMIRFWHEALSSRRLHIGMDETHDLGRGRFLDHHGYESAFSLFNRHLSRVSALCEKYGFHPIIWSDMYFRLGNKNQTYYDLNTNIPQEVRDRIPKSVQLCYWDYYNTDAEFYEKFIGLHRELGFNPIMGSGVWTWSRFWYDHRITCRSVIPCLQGCRKTQLRELFFTMWGDNGGYCVYDSALAGLEFASGLAFGHTPEETAFYSRRFRALCGEDFELFTSLGEIALYDREAKQEMKTEHLLWDDPLLGINSISFRSLGSDVPSAYRKRLETLSAKLENTKRSPSLDVVSALIRFLLLRLSFDEELLAAWKLGDRSRLQALADREIPNLTAVLDEFSEAFRTDWLSSAKPFGLEVIQRRNAGLRARFLELQRRLREGGAIPELDARLHALELGEEAPARLYSGSVIL